MAQAKQQAFMPMEPSKLNKEISDIGRTGNRLNFRIQIAALNAIHYSIGHGDVGFASRLVMALNATQRKQALVNFLEKFGKLQWSKEQKDMIFRKRDDVTIDSVETITDLWWDAKNPQAPLRSSLDVEESFEKWLKRMEKEAKLLETNNKSVKHKEWLEAVAEFHAQWHAKQIEAETAEQEEDLAESTKDALEGKPERRRTIRQAA